jgi:endo-1,4-beta-xylanase
MAFWKKLPRLPRKTFLGVGIVTAIGLGLTGFQLMQHIFTDYSQPQPGTYAASEKPDMLAGQWAYMPGAVPEDDGLKVEPPRRAIVEQDGSGGQTNAPINLFGSSLDDATDFSLRAEIADLKGTAVVQLYGEAPVIADEFRVERRSVRLTLSTMALQAELWDGTSQQPVVSKSFPITVQTHAQLYIAHQQKTLTLKVDDQVAGSLPVSGLFDDQKVWLGLDGSDTWRLAGLEAKALSGAKLTVVDGSAIKLAGKDPDGLQRLLSKKRPDFRLGAAMALGPAMTDPAYASVAFGGNFGMLTTENALKWQFVHPEPDTYTFQEADALVALAEKYHLQVHGHTLVFAEANPRWVQDLPAEAVEGVMLDHIQKVVGRYKGRMVSWDVVNEPLADYDDFVPGETELRQHKWFRAMGEAYIAKAFRAAHKADPKALLFLNEYGLEADGERWDGLIALVKRLQAQNVPIDGVGFQAHVYEAADRIDPATLRRHIRQLEELGLKVRISEMDVYSDDGVEVQAAQYADVLAACLAEPNCVSFTTWGVSDRYDYWRDDDGSIQQGEDFLWNAAMQPTLAVSKIKEFLR